MKTEVLQILRQTADYVSGESISRRLGVTRAAVWKAVQALRQTGYLVEAVTHRGYRLAGTADVLSQAEIEDSLAAHGLSGFIRQVCFTPAADSTNQQARQAADAGAPDGSLFVTGHQLAGRGRRGRRWLSDHSQGLWFSLLLRPPGEPAAQARLTLFAGLCVVQALRECLAVDSIGIKWPNDLVAVGSGRKAGGILTEMVVEENQISSVIIGIGLNILTEQFPDEIRDTATSLFLESGRQFGRTAVLTAILSIWARRYPEYLATDLWLADYRRFCLTLGRSVQVHSAGGTVWSGLAQDLDAAGELVVIDQAGRRQVVRSGEVSVRGLPG
jgi:BirA family transcriptional regulator, biotin operon repressor / biotin---[acetyl-CoA-carboxylase] ligase